MNVPRPPKHLSKEAKKWWRKINEGWQLDNAALLILTSALESFDRMRQAQELVKQAGLVVKDRFGTFKENPAIAVERKSRDSMVRCLKALNLDIEPLYDKPGRPGGT